MIVKIDNKLFENGDYAYDVKAQTDNELKCLKKAIFLRQAIGTRVRPQQTNNLVD